jgi:hypothetical protein
MRELTCDRVGTHMHTRSRPHTIGNIFAQAHRARWSVKTMVAVVIHCDGSSCFGCQLLAGSRWRPVVQCAYQNSERRRWSVSAPLHLGRTARIKSNCDVTSLLRPSVTASTVLPP